MVTTFEQARFLDDALRSVLSQTLPVRQIIVVDDGSHDDPEKVVARYPGIEFIRQSRGGPNSARNAGLAATTGDVVLFLDADDVLLPRAVELGVQCFTDNPGCGLVYGSYRRVDEALRFLDAPPYRPAGTDAFRALLGGNLIGMHGAVLYDRASLSAIGGLDPAIWKCEDYDTFLRMAARFPIASHPNPVALYRIHRHNASHDAAAMLDAALCVLDRHRPPAGDAPGMAAFRAGRRRWRLLYAAAAWRPAGFGRAAMMRRAPLESLAAAGWRAVRWLVPASLRPAIKRLAGFGSPAVGQVDMGDFVRSRPISPHFGYDRGTPVDRWYIERFLADHAGDIHGRVLEVGDDAYSRRFGHDIVRQDVLHVTPGSSGATIVGDISQDGILPAEVFDCLVITQTLHLIYGMSAAIERMRQSLAPGGVLLLTVPGVCSVDRGEWGGVWYWSLTRASLERLLAEAFGSANVSVEVFGNVYAATCFLQGLAIEEIDLSLLDSRDDAYPMIVCARAQRAA